jgi:hypothetical protein
MIVTLHVVSAFSHFGLLFLPTITVTIVIYQTKTPHPSKDIKTRGADHNLALLLQHSFLFFISCLRERNLFFIAQSPKLRESANIY